MKKKRGQPKKNPNLKSITGFFQLKQFMITEIRPKKYWAKIAKKACEKHYNSLVNLD